MSATRLKQCETCVRCCQAHPTISTHVACSLGLTMVCDEPCRSHWPGCKESEAMSNNDGGPAPLCKSCGHVICTCEPVPKTQATKSEIIRLLFVYWRLNERIFANRLIHNVLRPRKDKARRAKLVARIMSLHRELMEVGDRLTLLVDGPLWEHEKESKHER